MGDFYPTANWFSMAEDVIVAAKRGMAVTQYQNGARLQPVSAVKSYYDRLAVLEKLVDDGLVLIRDKKLKVGQASNVTWLNDLLNRGSISGWGLVSSIDPEYQDKKFNASRLEEIGIRGEEFVINLLKERLPLRLHDRIQHVSKRDDSAGFDIYAPSSIDFDKRVRLEVKTSVLPGEKFQCFLSANEFKVGIKTASWNLVAVRLEDGACRLLGHSQAFRFDARMPQNKVSDVSWAVAKLRIEENFFTPGLP